MAGRISCGNNEEIRKILAGCFKRDLKERWNPARFLESINNEIMRQERGGQIRPQTVPPAPISSSMKAMESNGKTNIISESTHQRPLKNRHMTPTEYHNDRYDGSRSQSPFKNRFVNQLPRDSSPSARGNRKDESPLKVTIKGHGNNLKNLTEMLLFLYRLLGYIGDS